MINFIVNSLASPHVSPRKKAAKRLKPLAFDKKKIYSNGSKTI